MAMRTKTDTRDADGVQTRGGSWAVTLVLWLFVACCAVSALICASLLRDLSRQTLRQSQAAAAEQSPARQLARAAAAAVQGDEGAFTQLRGERDHLQHAMDGGLGGDPAAPSVAALGAAWQAYRGGADQILEAQDAIVGVRASLATITPLLTKLGAAMASAAELIAAEGAPSEQVLEAGWQLSRIESMKASLGVSCVTGGAALPVADAMLGSFAVSLQELIAQAGTRAESAAAPALEDTARHLDALRTATDAMLSLVPQAQPAVASLGPLQAAGDQFAATLDHLVAAAWERPRVARLGPLPVGLWSVPLFGALALLGAGLLALRAFRRLATAAQRRGGHDGPAVTPSRNPPGGASDHGPDAGLDQDSDGDLDGGDGTARAPWGAGGAGDDLAVARGPLPGRLDLVAGQLMQSAAHSRDAAVRQVEAAAEQSGQIVLACGAIQSLVEDIAAVRTQAGESAGVAAHSAAVVGETARAAREALMGLAAGRDHCAEIGERIGRVGIASQALGTLVEGLVDGVEETKILALNAVIQATAAVQPEQGLAAFADEVQRCVGQSSERASRIEALAHGIQADARGALLSLEAVDAAAPGVDPARQAADALREIEERSVAAAQLAAAVAAALEQRSRQAAGLAETVAALRATTAQSAQGTRDAAQSQEDVVALAAELQALMAGPRVP